MAPTSPKGIRGTKTHLISEDSSVRSPIQTIRGVIELLRRQARPFVHAVTLLVSLLISVPASQATAGSPTTVLRVGSIAPRLASLPEFVAADLLAKHGYRVDWKHFQSDGAIVQAMAGRALDFAIATPIGAAHANEQGDPVRMLTVSWATLDWVFVSRRGIASIRDLAGKTVAISSPGSPTDVLFRRLLSTRNLTPDSLHVTLARVGATGARAAALQSGRADAAWLGYDAAYPLIKRGDFHVLENISVAKTVPGFLTAVWMANLTYVNAHRDIAGLVVEAQIEANRWAHNKLAFEAEAARTTLPGIQGLPREVIEWAYDRYIQDGVFPINGGLTTSALGTTFQIAKETGDLTRIPAPDEVALLQIQDDVLARIGRR